MNRNIIVFALIILLAVVIWLVDTTATLQHDHTVMCANVAQTAFTNYHNWGC